MSDSMPDHMWKTEDEKPYVPAHNYPKGQPKMCPCGHHEGFHNDKGQCIHAQDYDRCGCKGLPLECLTTDAEFIAE